MVEMVEMLELLDGRDAIHVSNVRKGSMLEKLGCWYAVSMLEY